MQLESLGLFAGYFALKLAVYSAWCVLGVRLFRPQRSARLGLGLAFGVLRVGLGLGFGVVIFFGCNAVYGRLHEADVLGASATLVATYLAVYLPVRWIEWAIVDALLNPATRGLAGFLGGAGKQSRLWRLGGVGLSCLADVPVVLAIGGLPLGRFLC